MSKKKKKGLFFLPIIIFITIFALKFWAQVTCDETKENFTEDFNDTDYRDEPLCSVDHWGDGYITLNKVGANFDVANPDYIPVWINTVAANDFNGDGWPDFVGSSSSYSNVLAFVQNMGVEGQIKTFEITQWIDGSDGQDGWPTLGVQGAPIDGNGHCGMTSGDYDGDGDYDFLHMSSQNDNPWTPERIWLYENHLVDEGNFYFTQTDLTSAWSAAIKGIAWSTTMMVSVDIDKDGDLDILTGNRAGEVLLLRNTGSQQIDVNTFFIEPQPVVDTGWGPRGVSTLSVADFNSDGNLDIFVGSVSYSRLKYYTGDETNNFTLYQEYYDPNGDTSDNDFDGAATVSICHDFDADGDPDLMIGTDNWNYKPGGEEIGGQCYYFKNEGGDFRSLLLFDDRPTVYDFDLGAVFDFDQDGDTDFLIADGNHTELYYLFINELADVYNLIGTAVSTNVTPNLDPSLYAITRVRIWNLEQQVIGGSDEGLAVEYYVSNNGGRDWEFYARHEGSEIQDYSRLPWYDFKHFGSQLKWKAILTAPEDEMAEHTGASFETPKIDKIVLRYAYVERNEYSRTSVVATTVEEDDETKKIIIGASFHYPGWEGHLRAYDVTEMSLQNNTYSELITVTKPDEGEASGRYIQQDVKKFWGDVWDAAELLNSRLASDRDIYTAIPEDSRLTRCDFTVDQVVTLGPILQDVNGDNSGLINFVRGEGRDWKLGDINHSNPIIVGPPDGDPNLMGEDYKDKYEKFMEDYEDRAKVLYVGANDGMIHCFNVLTGKEMWGFIPYNLLPKLRNMWQVDPDTGERYFLRDAYVDGSPVAADVYIDPDGDGPQTASFRTILMCGQGPGNGSTLAGGTTGNFYFALDITNPENPQPLWEFTHDRMGETWSRPIIGRISRDDNDTWAAFMGSGYDNVTDTRTGNRFYAVDVESGEGFWTFNARGKNTNNLHGWNIRNTLPGSPSAIDIDQDGDLDRVYFGDLNGRMRRVDVSEDFEVTGVDETSWDDNVDIIYTDSNYYPILTKPTVYMKSSSSGANPSIYFGTGGDDKAELDNLTFSFIALIDNGTPGEVEWFIGDDGILGLPAERDRGDFATGEKVWADPVVANYIVYFSTLTGSIESVNPCLDLEGLGNLYARFVEPFAGTLMGGTAFMTSTGPIGSLPLLSKGRAAVTVGERSQTETGVRKREVYIQEFDSTIERLEQPISAILHIKSWREIFKIIK